MKNELEKILNDNLPASALKHVGIGKNCLGSGTYYKISFAASSFEIKGVKGQLPQLVSLCLDEDFTLYPQAFGGMGGNWIETEPNDEKYLAIKRLKVPFRKPKKEKQAVFQAIERFCTAWILLLKENREKLCYQKNVDYNELLLDF